MLRSRAIFLEQNVERSACFAKLANGGDKMIQRIRPRSGIVQLLHDTGGVKQVGEGPREHLGGNAGYIKDTEARNFHIEEAAGFEGASSCRAARSITRALDIE